MTTENNMDTTENNMDEAPEAPRETESDSASDVLTLRIDPKKIRDVIGKGGSTIRALTKETGTKIDIDDDGEVRITSTDNASAEEARERIELLTGEVEIGKTYTGKVVRIMDFGAFIGALPGRDGLVHISQIAEYRVKSVDDELSEGQVVNVKVLDIDEQGRVKLTMKEVQQP